jgi:hypothetical protein
VYAKRVGGEGGQARGGKKQPRRPEHPKKKGQQRAHRDLSKRDKRKLEKAGRREKKFTGGKGKGKKGRR